jgi:hypothetical protein
MPEWARVIYLLMALLIVGPAAIEAWRRLRRRK